MSFTGKMMEGMMGGMSPEKMQEMMDQFFSATPSEDKQKMMDGMKGMMMNMMGGLMDGAESADMPWDMCKKMMGNIGKASDLAAYATPELRGLFEEWLEQINDEVVAFIKKEGKADPATLAEHFKISKESIHYILGKLAQNGRITLKAEI